MEGCLLCLQIKKNFEEFITVHSKQWQELNVKSIIEKHLWPMVTMESSSWLCTTCWQEVDEFHKFYIRIEKAHAEFGLIMKNEVRTQSRDFKDTFESHELYMDKYINNNNSSNEFHLESEISMQATTISSEVAIEEQKFIIKEELDEELCLDDMPLMQRRKRQSKKSTNKIQSKNEDPLNKSKQPKRPKTIKPRIKKNKKSTKKIILATEPFSEQPDEEQSNIKQDPELLHFSKETNVSLNLHDSNKSDDTDSNFEPDKEESLEIKKKIKSRCDSYNTPKTNRQEKDKFIAENFKISCEICQIPIETFKGMCKHYEMQHNQQGYVICCNKKFFRRSVLVDHVHRHLDPNYFKCQQCGKALSDRRCLELHVKAHEGKPEKIHSCEICGKSFGTLAVLKGHKLIHLSEEEKQFPCSECGKNFGNTYLLSNHFRVVHLNKYAKICYICGKSIRCKEIYERHMLEHEGKAAPTISCDICGLLLTGKRGLKQHKDMIHPVGGKQEYTCLICSKVSPNLKAHKRHVQYKHELGYDHKCTICEKAFKRAQALMEHMATHTGTVLYTCPWCPKTFNSNANMHNHRKKGHPKEWEEATRKRYSGNLPP